MIVDRSVTLVVCWCFAFPACTLNHAQEAGRAPVNLSEPVRSVIASKIDESRLTRLSGNTHPMARQEFDRGSVDPQLSMKHLLLVLKRSPEQEAALETFMARQLDPATSDFHHWLTPEEFGKAFGPSNDDISAITNWLENRGFSIDIVSQGHTFIEFSGTAGQVKGAFHTELHRYVVDGREHLANNTDPSIPEALSPVVAGVFSLNDFFSHPLHRNLGSFHRSTKNSKWEPDDPNVILKPLFSLNYQGAQLEWVAPYDFATIYNVLPLWNAGIDGTGQTIAIAGRSDVDLSDIASFRSSFGLPENIPTVITNGPDPGEPSVEDRVENTVDIEWSGAAAKGATIKFVTTASTMTTDGAFESALYIIDNDVAPIMSFSYGNCELALGAGGNAAFNSLWQQGAAEGITEFVASGDQGSAACDGGQPSPYIPQNGLAVSGTSSTPYDVAVGGTDLQWVNLTGSYWNSSNNNTNLSSALGYIPEVPWNGTCASVDELILSGLNTIGYDNEKFCNFIKTIGLDAQLLNATGGTGGVSDCTAPTGNTVASCTGGYSKPAWQTGTGVPADGKRDVPDLALFASNAALNSAYVFCDSEIGPCNFSLASDAAAQGIGGTSVSSPAMAGIMALVLQRVGGAAQGLANPIFYQLASQEDLSNCNSSTVSSGNGCAFYDITYDNNRVPCAAGSPNCTIKTSGDAVGILNGYDTTTGYDLATGLGSVNAYNLANAVNSWLNTTAARITSPVPSSTLLGTSTTFSWSAGGSGTTGYFLWIGSSPGTFNLANLGEFTTTSTTVTLPTTGATIYLRLWTVINDTTFIYNDYTYTEANTVPAAMISPVNGSTLSGASTTFTWSAGSNVTGYFLWIGSSPGTFNLANLGQFTTTSTTVTLPTTGATIYVRLWSVINGTPSRYNDYTYTEAQGGP